MDSDTTSLVMVDRPFTAFAAESQAKRVGARHGNQWCHMWVNPGDEEALHAMARKIGMKREWFQAKPGFPHYDLIPTKRVKAVAEGAVETDLKDWLKTRKAIEAALNHPPRMGKSLSHEQAEKVRDALCHAAHWFVTQTRDGSILDAALDNHERDLREALRIVS